MASTGLAVGGLTLVAGCSSPAAVTVEAPDLDPGQAQACRAFLADLPATLAGEESRRVEPDGVPGAAWGDPPLVLTCGVPVPEGFDEDAGCTEVTGVGWFVEEGDPVRMTTVGHRPLVTVTVPAGRPPETAAAVLAELAAPVAARLELVQPCQ